MARPEFKPEWATDDVILPEAGNENKLRPPQATRLTGWDYKQKPPVNEINWMLNNIYLWIEHLDSLTASQGITEIASQQQAIDGASNSVLMTPLRTLQSIQANAVPPGTVVPFAGTSAPSGWLFCDGSAISRTTYSNLFDEIGTVWGAGDGSTTFNIPDSRNEFIRGADPVGGRNVADSETDQIAAHTHTGTTASDGAHTHTLNGITQSGDSDGFDSTGISKKSGTIQSTNSAGAHTHSFTTNSTGGSETRPQNIAMMYIIKT